ncbi:MAG: hypothetical protein V1809_01930 [Planctomycetota bacterium]
MKTFKDNAGRTWAVAVDISAVKRVRSLLDVNLLDVLDGRLIERLAGDPVLLCDVIFALVKPEADAKGITDEDFGRAMAGDVVEQATTAFLEALTDFFPQGKRRLLQKALGKLKAWETKALDVAEKRLESPELEQKLDAALNPAGSATTSENSSGNLPGSSG